MLCLKASLASLINATRCSSVIASPAASSPPRNHSLIRLVSSGPARSGRPSGPRLSGRKNS